MANEGNPSSLPAVSGVGGTVSNPGRLVSVQAPGLLQESQILDAVTGAVLTISGGFTADRNWAIPDRSDTVAGLGAQTFTGNQTINANLFVGTPLGGSEKLQVGGDMRVGLGGGTGYTVMSGKEIEIGVDQTSDSLSLIDFHTAEGTYPDNTLRLIRYAGANGAADLVQRGTGSLRLITAEAAVIEFWTSNTQRMVLSSGGEVGIGVTPTAGNGLAQFPIGTTKATGIAFGDTFQFRNAPGQISQNGPSATDIVYTATRSTGESVILAAGTSAGYTGTSSLHNFLIRTNSITAITIDTAQGVRTNAAVYLKTRVVTSSGGNTNLDASDHRILVTGTSGHSLNLPPCSTGREMIITNRSTMTLTFNRNGSDTIRGGTSSFSVATNQTYILLGNGTDWDYYVAS